MRVPRAFVRVGLLMAVAFAVSAPPGGAQSIAGSGPQGPVPALAAPAPRPRSVMVRAVRLDAELRVDGRLDDAVYGRELPVSGFLQQVPHEGAPATEPTDVWVFFDDSDLYVAARCWDSAPPTAWVANELRRDAAQISQNDSFAVLLDTFFDGRDGFLFATTPIGAIADQQITEERASNVDWNPVWDVRTARFDRGWTVEMRIPFTSLRYRTGAAPTWGIQLRRVVRRLNEWSYATAVPIAAAGRDGSQGILRVSAAAALVGLDPPAGGARLELKPYAIGRVKRDPATTDGTDGDVGLDMKYGVTESLTADLTYNTDFAQVEADQQQINLSRFNLQFPEKRDFFLEGRGIFDFGRTGGDVPVLFFSRRIGLEEGREVPIRAGGRLTGKAGAYTVGALSIATADTPETHSTTFSVFRVKRNVLRRSSVGAMYTNRSASTVGNGANHAYGVDARLAFMENVNVNGFLARTDTPGRPGRNTSHHLQFDYPADRYAVRVERLVVERNFTPDVGFLRRTGFERRFAEAAFKPRPRSLPAVRQFTFETSLNYIATAGTGQLESREQLFSFETEFADSGRFELDVVDGHERIDSPFDVDGLEIPAGSYDFRHVEAVYTLGRQRRANGSVLFRRGGFYGGGITVLELTSSRIEASPRLSIEPGLSVNRISLPVGLVTSTLARSRVTFTFTPRMFVSGLVQLNTESDHLSANLRFRWEYRPGSEVFVVYGEERETRGVPASRPGSRGIAVKINRLLRY